MLAVNWCLNCDGTVHYQALAFLWSVVSALTSQNRHLQKTQTITGTVFIPVYPRFSHPSIWNTSKDVKFERFSCGGETPFPMSLPISSHKTLSTGNLNRHQFINLFIH